MSRQHRHGAGRARKGPSTRKVERFRPDNSNTDQVKNGSNRSKANRR